MSPRATRLDMAARNSYRPRRALSRSQRPPSVRRDDTVGRTGGAVHRSEARKWLARELHDGPVQTLTGLVVGLETLRLDQVAAAENGEHVQSLVDAARTCMHELRSLLSEMRAEPLGAGDVIAEVNHLAARFKSASGMRVTLKVPPTPLAMAGYESLELQKILGEALTNVRRHSEAKAVAITLTVTGSSLQLTVVDDGRGFDGSLTPAGHGRRGMFERAAVLGAALSVVSDPGGGTAVKLIMPLRRTSR